MEMKHIAIIIGIVAFVGSALYFTRPEVTPNPPPVGGAPSGGVQEGYSTEQESAPRVEDSPQQKEVTKPSTTTNQKNMKATIRTNKGAITIELNSTDAPNTVANFVKLAKDGFYDGVKFHRVIAGFMIQGGDPLTKDDSKMALWGTGGPGYKFADEIHANNKNNAGTISMANAGPNTNGSQFFINVNNNNFLDPKHTVFGTVIEGLDVVKAIEGVETGAQDRPVSPVVIESISVQ